MKIEICNLRNVKLIEDANVVYLRIDRGHSSLANQFRIGKDGTRSEVITKYRRWLWAEMQKSNSNAKDCMKDLLQFIRNGEKIYLCCWCAPKACHGEVIRNCLEWMSAQDKI